MAKLASLFGVPVLELRRWTDGKELAQSKIPDAKSIQQSHSELERIARVHELVCSDAEFRSWLRTARPMLQNRSPLDWLREGKLLEVAEYADDLITGQPS